MFGSKRRARRKAESEAYHEHVKSLLKNSKPNGGTGYDAEELARQEQAGAMFSVRRHVDKHGRVVR